MVRSLSSALRCICGVSLSLWFFELTLINSMYRDGAGVVVGGVVDGVADRVDGMVDLLWGGTLPPWGEEGQEALRLNAPAARSPADSHERAQRRSSRSRAARPFGDRRRYRIVGRDVVLDCSSVRSKSNHVREGDLDSEKIRASNWTSPAERSEVEGEYLDCQRLQLRCEIGCDRFLEHARGVESNQGHVDCIVRTDADGGDIHLSRVGAVP